MRFIDELKETSKKAKKDKKRLALEFIDGGEFKAKCVEVARKGGCFVNIPTSRTGFFTEQVISELKERGFSAERFSVGLIDDIHVRWDK